MQVCGFYQKCHISAYWLDNYSNHGRFCGLSIDINNRSRYDINIPNYYQSMIYA